MQTIQTTAVAKVVAVAIGLAMAVSMFVFASTAKATTLTSAQVSAIVSLLQSFGADSATIANVQAALTGAAPAVPTVPTAPVFNFTRNLTIGSSGADVTHLQNALIANGYSIPAGATGTFGPQTRAAVIAWQRAEGITPAAGFFGPISRAAFDLRVTPVTPVTPTPGVPGVPPITGTGLGVVLATDSPRDTVLVQGQATGEIARYTFSNPTETEIRVTNVVFNRTGVSTDAALTNVYLFRGETRLTDPSGVSNSVFSFNNPAGIFTVPARGTATISVNTDIATTGAAGQQIGVRLVSLASTGVLDAAVSFPINSHMHTVSSATLAGVTFTGIVTPTGGTLSPATDTTLFRSTANVVERAVLLRSITFTNRGTTADGDFQNLRLLVRGVPVGTTVSGTTNRMVTFDLSANPVRIETGLNEIRLQGDIVGGSGRNFDFQIRRAVDARFIDSNLHAAIVPTGTMAPVDPTGIDRVSLSITRATGSPSGNVALGATNVLFGRFEFRAMGDNLRIDQLSVRASSTGNHGLDNGRIFLNGVQVGSTRDITDAGTVFSLGGQMTLTRGTVAVVEIFADARRADGGAYVTGNTAIVEVSVAAADTSGVVSGDRILNPINNVAGFQVTMSTSALTATRFTGFSDRTTIAGTNNVRIGSFVLSAGSTEGVNVNNIVINFADAAMAGRISDLRLADNVTGAAIGTTRATVAESNAFSVSGVNIPASGTRIIDVFANIRTGATPGFVIATLTAGTSGVGAVTGNSVSIANTTLQTITVGTAALSVAVNTARTPESANVIAGREALVGSFRFTAQHSAFTVQELNILVPAAAQGSVGMVTLRGPGLPTAGVSQPLGPTSGTNRVSTFTGLTFAVPANGEASLDVHVSIPGMVTAMSGNIVSVSLDNTGFRAVDGAGTAVTSLAGFGAPLSAATTGRGTMVVRGTVPTLASVALPSTVLTAGTNQTIARVSVAANTAGDLSLNRIVFTVSKNASTTLDTFQLFDGATAVAGSFTPTGTGAGSTSGTIVFTSTDLQQIAAGTSRTYELRATVGGLATGNNFVDISIANPSTAVTTAGATAVAGVSPAPSFVWSDRSAIPHSLTTGDWTNDLHVRTLPLTVGNLSRTI